MAVSPPMSAAAEHDLPVHMAQHVLLLAVAAPLLAVGLPLAQLASRLPTGRPQRQAAGFLAGFRSASTWWSWVAVLLGLQTVVMMGWHAPALYSAAVHSEGLHVVEHLTFVLSATAFWVALVVPDRRARGGPAVLASFLAAFPGIALGLSMTLARTPWYAAYADRPDALELQQVAGVVMWGFGGLASVVAGAALFFAWIWSAEQADPEGLLDAQAGRKSR